jgi:hypothetical protein
MKKPMTLLSVIPIVLFVNACVATDPVGSISSVQITGMGVTGSGANKGITVKVGQPVALGLTIQKTGSPDLTESRSSANSSVVFVLPDSGAIWGLTENAAGVVITASIGSQSDTILVKVESGDYYTKEYIAANTIMVSDELAPNVKNNPVSENPDPSLGFDIQVTFPNAVVADPKVMAWGYWLDSANGLHAIKEMTFSESIALNTLTINCIVDDLSGMRYDKGVLSGFGIVEDSISITSLKISRLDAHNNNR